MKKLITSIVLSTALVGGACMATGCSPSNSASNGNDVATVEELNSATAFYTYGAASIGSIISAAEATEGTTQTPPVGGEGTTETPVVGGEGTTETPVVGGEGTTETPAVGGEGTTETPAEPEQPSNGLTEEQLNTVNGYMGLVENMLANGGLSYISLESDRDGYETKQVISFSDLEGNVITYVMYFNSTLDYVETDFDDDAEETEAKYTIEGIMIINDVEYALEGYSEVETSDKESETETYFKVTLADGSYIIMEQEAEAGETELVYKVVSDKKVVEKIKFETEIENGQTEIKMTVEKNGVKTSLKFAEETENGVTVIKVTAKGGESDVSFKIEVAQDEGGNNVYRYTFGDKIKEMHKNHSKEKDFDDDKLDDGKWNHGEWNQGEHGNGKWQWHVDEDKDHKPVEAPELPIQSEAPSQEPIPQDVEAEIVEQITNFINGNHNGWNRR